MNIDKVAILVKKSALECEKISHPVLEKYDLTMAQYKILKLLYSEEYGTLRLMDVEKYFSLTHPTAIGILQNLEKKGLIERLDNPKHTRSKFIVPSHKALAIRKELETVGEDLENELTYRLNSDERSQLVLLLKKMLGI